MTRGRVISRDAASGRAADEAVVCRVARSPDRGVSPFTMYSIDAEGAVRAEAAEMRVAAGSGSVSDGDTVADPSYDVSS